jgi:hypothetical protein
MMWTPEGGGGGQYRCIFGQLRISVITDFVAIAITDDRGPNYRAHINIGGYVGGYCRDPIIKSPYFPASSRNRLWIWIVTTRRLIFTRHSEEMLVQREIDREWVTVTIFSPDFVEADTSRPGVLRAFRAIKERGGRFLRVVYVSEGDNFRILTAFFDRARSRT